MFIKGILVVIIAYLLGCFSTGILISRSKGVDIRNAGSKNTGTSNVLRVMGIKSGLLTFVGDCGKALLACWIGSLLLPQPVWGIERFGVMLAGLVVILGHNWPVFYQFKGGKGVACSAAVVVFVSPLWGGIACLVAIIVIAWTRYISVGSMCLLFAFTVGMVISQQWYGVVFGSILLLLCVWRHRENIKRLCNGTENKIGKRVSNT